MSQELLSLVNALLPGQVTVRLADLTVADEQLLLHLTATATTALCPLCATPSASIHSRYQRQLVDVPWGTLSVRIQLTVRKFVCCNPDCARRIFTERLPDLVESYARKTTRLVSALRSIGLALGGQAGARLARRLRYPTSPAMLRRLVRRAPLPVAAPPVTVGIDEWAWRRAHQYGTILVNLADHRVVDLLPDRSAESVARWLAQRPTITLVCRDRSELYADGIRRGAPDALQVVDRFHLVQNLREAVESVLVNQRPALQQAAERTAHVLAPAAEPLAVTPM
jgi:transposase